MFQTFTRRRGLASRSNRRAKKQQTHTRPHGLGLESLEPRQMLSGTPADLQFRVLNDATANVSYSYAADGTSLGNSALAGANAAPRGAASMIGLDKTWVIDANRTVYVYNATGGLLGSWTAGSMPSKATPEGIATNGTDIWIVDSKSDKVYRYAGAASLLSGNQNAASSFSLYAANWAGVTNLNAKDIVTDGAHLWIVDDTSKADRVFKYTMDGSLAGYWSIDSANKAPSGIALDPANVGDLWIADSGTDRVYRYAGATARADYNGSQAAAGSFALSAGNGNAQGIAVAGRPWAETPYQVEWVRQFGTSADDWGRGVTTDPFGSIYVSGVVDGSLSGPTVGTPYLARYDAAGNLIWQQNSADQIGHEAVRVAADVLGNVFQVISPSADGTPASLNNYGPDGARRWTTYVSPGEHIFSVTVDDLGFAYMASYIGNGNIFVRKIGGEDGAILWTTPLTTGGTNNSTGISADHRGNIYVAAYTSGSLLGPNVGSYDGLLIKLSDAGSVLWTSQFGTPDADYAFIVSTDALGNAYISGQTRGSLGGALAGDQDNFLVKYDPAGNQVWRTQFGTSGSDSSSSGWIDAQGNVYRSMTTAGALGGAHYGDSDIVVVKYDPSGSIRWATQLGTSGADGTGGGIWGDAAGNLYVAGRTTGSLLGGTSVGGSDAVLIKLSPPVAAASGSSLDSVDASAAPKISEVSLRSGAAIRTISTSAPQRGQFVPAARPTISIANDVQTSSLNVLNGTAAAALAREQVFESIGAEREFGPSKRALWATIAERRTDELAVTELVLESALAGVH